jgi:hypothetical protein
VTDNEINETLALAMGWRKANLPHLDGWVREGLERVCDLPDYLGGPSASAELLDWLWRQGWDFCTDSLRSPEEQYVEVNICGDSVNNLPDGEGKVGVASDKASSAFFRALALAAVRAIKAGKEGGG